MSRPALARIDLEALRQNYSLAQSLHGKRALAVLKANAYGHGAVACAKALEGLADGFAVAFLDEALELRESGIAAPILILEGAFDRDELLAARQHDLWLVVHQERQLSMIEQLPPAHAKLQVWLKIDSGMHRAGIAPHQASQFYWRLQNSGRVQDVVLMSHFARADEPEQLDTDRQMRVFEAATAGLERPRSLCNSAGLLAWPQARQDWARPGIMLYGVNPVAEADEAEIPLQPVMQLRSQIFAERWLEPGEQLGYGGLFVAEKRTRVGLVAMGYADGYPRSATTGTPVAIDGQMSRIIGRVSMDMLTVDLTDLRHSGVGSDVELWGKQVPVNTVAQHAGTIAYELLCNVKRVRFAYQDRKENLI